MKAFTLCLLALLLAGPTAAQEGIHVAGHWTLDVYAEDGSLVASRAFHNDLVPLGGRSLVRLLARDAEHGAWSLQLRSATEALATLTEPGTSGDDPNDPLDDLDLEIVNREAQGGEPVVLRLTGRAVMPAAGQIEVVRSLQYYCQYDEVALCGPETAGFLTEFTERALAAPLPVEADQTVDVTFELSFE